MSTTTTADVIVIGAGIVGASCAHHLAARGLKVIVLEQNSGWAEGSTGLSFASIRAQWADSFNIDMSLRSMRAYRDFEEAHGIDIGYRPTGYLILYPEHAWAAQLDAVALQRAHGVQVEVLDHARASAITPYNPEGVAGATWGPADGQIDPHIATGAYLHLAKQREAKTFFNRTVDRVEAREDGSWEVHAGESTFTAQHVVNAAGGWAGEVAQLAGLDVPVVHSKKNVYATAEGSLDRFVPMTIDAATGFYMRSEGTRLLFAGANPGQEDGYDTRVDWPWMESLLEIGVERFPWIDELPLDRSSCWAGTYENTPDHDGILGSTPEAPTWVNACGFSGHGLMQAPEVGRLVGEQIADGAITSLDVSRLSLERFRRTDTTNPSLSLVF